MKRMYSRALLIFTTAVLALSCDWLNVTPSNAVDEDDLFKTGYGCRNSLNGVYLKLGSTDLYGRNLSWGLLSSVARNTSPTTPPKARMLRRYARMGRTSFITHRPHVRLSPRFGKPPTR